jgi:acyl-CoA synthetase (AMP-forming)/AMP-acid ligase II
VEEALDALGAVLEQGFGQTETFPPTLALRREEHLLAGDAGREIRGSIGRPVGTCEVRLLGPKGVGDVPDGEPGEIAVRGDNVTPGYFGDPGATAAALRGGFFRTGDVAFRDERGYFHLLGRRAEAVERDGGTVWLRRMERAAELHPQVLEAAACTIDGLIVLAVVSRPGAASTESVGLEAFLERRLAPADRPDAVEWVGDLPRNVNMKLRRDALTQRLVARLRAGLPRQPAAVAREARR